ncbi:MAG: Rieske 2Fe-2S domain-containing protein [Acidobacteria bacterium]|nr:Rieske 2Fe-2S domain-containing protein [Acidobacteriota bacterium]
MVGRRGFLATLVVSALGLARRAWTQGAHLLRYRPLARPVAIPLEDMQTQWRARPFVADGVTLDTAAAPNQPIRISGMVVRTGPPGENTPERFQAVCLRCPHEGCDVDYVSDPKTLPPELVAEIGHPVTEPVYVCPCHNSTFTVEEGQRLAGPAPRGLYRFRVTSVSGAAIEIGEVEEDVLLFV